MRLKSGKKPGGGRFAAERAAWRWVNKSFAFSAWARGARALPRWQPSRRAGRYGTAEAWQATRRQQSGRPWSGLERDAATQLAQLVQGERPGGICVELGVGAAQPVHEGG